MLRSFLGRKSASTPSRFRPRAEPLDERINPQFAAGYDAITFAAQQSFAAGGGTNPSATAVGDFDADGKQDVAVLNGTAGTVSLLLNTTPAGAASATFAAPQAYALPAGMTPRAFAVGDLNLDGKSDIVVVGEAGQYGVVAALLSTPSPPVTIPANGELRPVFALSDGRLPTFRPTSVALGDFDGDGRLDIAATDPATNSVMIVQNKTPLGGTQLALNPWLRYAAGPNPDALAVGDFNGDGTVDLVAANGSAGTVTVLLNQTPPPDNTLVFSSATVATGIADPTALTATDFDRDGVIDLVVAGAQADGNGAVDVLWNRTRPGSLQFTASQTASIGAGATPSAVAVSDFNADGLPDLATTATLNGNTVAVFQGTGAKTGTALTPSGVYAVGGLPVGLAVGDFNQDGKPDLVTTSGPTVSVLPNTSGGVSYRALYGQFGSDLWSTSAASGSGASWSQALLNTRISTGAGGGVSAGARSGVAASGGNRIGLAYGNNQARFLATAPATALATDPLGRVWAAFDGAGVAVYSSATNTWAGLPGTAATADKLAVSANGDVFANFVGSGVYRYRSNTGWEQLNGYEATSLNVDANGSVVANFAGFGIGQYIPYAHGWRLLANRGATAITVSDAGTIYASFEGTGGISKWSAATGTWTALAFSAPAVSLAADLFGHVYAAFPGYGVLKFTVGVGWAQMRATDASSLALADIFYTDVLFPYTPSL